MRKMSNGSQDQIIKLSKNSWILILVFIALLLFFSILFFFRSKPEYVSKVDIVLGTTVKVVVSSDKDPNLIVDAVLREFHRIDRKFSVTDPKSVISRINKSDSPVEIDEETAFVIERSLALARATEGAFDPALGNLITLWGFDRINDSEFKPSVPSDTQIEEALEKSGYENIQLKNDVVILENSVKLDLGGVVKGYAIDRGISIAKEMDPNATGYIDAGRDIGIIGPKFGGEYWSIAVQDPRGEGEEYIDIVYLKKGTIVTSGDYERFFILDDVKYHHILNPKTGYPVKDTISTTVISPDAMDADAFSTAAFVLGSDFSAMLLPVLGGQGLFVDSQKQMTQTEGWSFFKEKH
ncbi:MAG: FAD:protein FMN transferase [Thermotogota bacterium]